MNIIAPQEFEFAYFDATVQDFSHHATEILPLSW